MDKQIFSISMNHLDNIRQYQLWEITRLYIEYDDRISDCIESSDSTDDLFKALEISNKKYDCTIKLNENINIMPKLIESLEIAEVTVFEWMSVPDSSEQVMQVFTRIEHRPSKQFIIGLVIMKQKTLEETNLQIKR